MLSGAQDQKMLRSLRSLKMTSAADWRKIALPARLQPRTSKILACRRWGLTPVQGPM